MQGLLDVFCQMPDDFRFLQMYSTIMSVQAARAQVFVKIEELYQVSWSAFIPLGKKGLQETAFRTAAISIRPLVERQIIYAPLWCWATLDQKEKLRQSFISSFEESRYTPCYARLFFPFIRFTVELDVPPESEPKVPFGGILVENELLEDEIADAIKEGVEVAIWPIRQAVQREPIRQLKLSFSKG